ncbi:hypothetical protein RND71_000027 [Anisodus tanguticus]|uniref:Flavin-containing monooxygenase n=1 Tax=Anisodus tanguticus TaxID=243964 RepID=A0AAE1SV65_9SOLA|nr:hypothetical protein RND71_000025 [Anisodus tanguticus]KAK4378165.1 hypothetical protein RND71_000027 [Anisodus tanguticus]
MKVATPLVENGICGAELVRRLALKGSGTSPYRTLEPLHTVCVGRFSQVPDIPEFPPNKGPEALEGEVIHSMDYSKMDSATANNFVKGKHVEVVGFRKSGMDIAMECSTVNGIECSCTIVIRTPHWNLPDHFPWGLSLGYLYQNRFSELTVHKPGEGLFLSLLATTLSPLGFYDRVEEGSIKLIKKAEIFEFSKEGIVLEDSDDSAAVPLYSVYRGIFPCLTAALHIWHNDQLCKDMGWNPKRKKGLLAEWFEAYGPLDYSG